MTTAAVLLPIGCMRVVPPGDDPWVVGRYMRLGRSRVEPCRPVDWFVSQLTQRYATPPTRNARCPRSGGAAQNQWREVGFAGMIGGDRRAMVMVSHKGIDRCEVQDVMRRRWPDVLIKKRGQEEPTWEMLPDDAAQLGRCRRGIEPMRVVIMPQQEEVTASSLIDSMPVLVG